MAGNAGGLRWDPSWRANDFTGVDLRVLNLRGKFDFQLAVVDFHRPGFNIGPGESARIGPASGNDGCQKVG